MSTKNYTLFCSCGAGVKIQLDAACQFLRVDCRCGVNLTQEGSLPGASSAPVSSAAPAASVSATAPWENKATNIDPWENKATQMDSQKVAENPAVPDVLTAQKQPFNPFDGSFEGQVKKTPAQPKKSDAMSKSMASFGHYQLIKLIGTGAMGKVYLAVNSKNNKQVALKLLHKNTDAKFLDLFLREAHILMELNHPNIIKLEDSGNCKGFPFIALEYIEGMTLAQWVKKHGVFQVRLALQVIYSLLEALEYAASKKMVHRDIKPENVFLGNKSEVKLIDMGIAKIKDDSFGLTQEGEIRGTSYYMPPEQIRDSKNVSYQSDLYATGCLLFFLLAGMPPFAEYTKFHALILAKTKNNYISLQERNNTLSPQVIAFVAKAMASDVQQRYSSATQMKQDIAELAKKIPR